MEYSKITKDQQKQILEGRIAAWEADHFGHEINLLALKAQETEDTTSIAQSKNALAILEASILAGREELAKLGE